jgi:stage II sporulation protein GA (sporulation sigma-E factor processing peptidase)
VPTVVYVDVLLVLNFMVNFVLLRVAALCSGRWFSGARGVLAAAAGAMGALVIFVPMPGIWSAGAFKLAVSAAMVLIAFPWAGVRALIKDIFCLFAVSFVFSGAMLAVYLALSPTGMTVYGGVVYFEIGAPALLFATAGCYLIVSLLSRLLWRRAPKEAICEVTVLTDRGVCVLPALIDTGSSLVEPFSGSPVMVCGEQDLGRALPPEIEGFSFEHPSASPGVRLVAFESLGQTGLLPAFVPRAIRVRTQQGERAVRKGSYVAVSQASVGTQQYRAILNPAMLQTNENKVGEGL